ncbi:MAG: hypothetical protein JSU65_04090 [Candidatus Zixiibacteriota bacterium]|nr:MAG: hypothetical protein JSU65_04090 [candidate division Zixibacteria bacterium]
MLLLLVAVCATSFSCIERKPERLAKQESPVTTELAAMVEELEQFRDSLSADQETLVAVRKRHRDAVYRLVAKALIREPQDLYRAALVLEAEEGEAQICLLAHYLAAEAARKGYQPARFLTAACLDRYRVLSGSSQAYGTQHYKGSDGLFHLYPIDSTTTDSVRAVWGVPSLDSLEAEIEAMNSH